MNRILSLSALLACAIFLLSSFSIRENPQDPPRGKKKEKHIKIEKIDDKGNKTEIDTIIKGDDFFVWNGDTIGNHKGFSWFSGDDFDLDSLHEKLNFDFDFSNDEEGNVFILKSGKSSAPMLYEFKTENDSTGEYKFEIIHDDGDESKAMIWNRKKPGQIMHLPKPGIVPHAPGIMFMERGKKDNVIDLSDSDIVSYKKRKMKGGREKITIVRKVPEDGNVKEEKEEIIISDVGENAVWHSKAPGKVHAVQVTKEMDGKVKVIKEGNKIIRITENKKDGEEQVEVKVEVETEKENN